MNDRPLVSILINNCNYGCYVDKAIESALNQTYSHLEVIVVDDGSIDNSREVIARYQDRVIPVLKENEGQSSALNVGFNIAKGDIICFLDADDLALLEKVSEVVNVFKNNPDIGWCFHSIKVMDMKTGKLLKRICHDNVYVTITEETKQSRSQKCDFRASMLERGTVSYTHL
ncbi:glucosyl transferase, partial [Chroococcidiopsis cubana CCALA 043]|uniref:glycosyltransferase family 2 protein n=1 Tax=Chroococcidiopsis cubana TaxID=171392 RepID=UPI000D4CD108